MLGYFAPPKRKLVRNGGFESYPPFVAATSTSNRWIDGTASGSTVNSTWNWTIPNAAGTATYSAQFDSSVSRTGSSSMKLSTFDASGAVSVATVLNASTPAFGPTLIALAPGTSYSLSGWSKTNNAATNAVFMDVREYNSSFATVVTNSSNKLSGTNDWSLLTKTFTTSATTNWGTILLRNTVSGNVSDAWFDDITLIRT